MRKKRLLQAWLVIVFYVVLMLFSRVVTNVTSSEVAMETKDEIVNTEEVVVEVEGQVFITKKTVYDSLGRMKQCYQYEYDENNHLIKEEIYDSTKVYILRNEYRYDNNGNKIEYKQVAVFGEMEQLRDWDTWEYDENGYLTVHRVNRFGREQSFLNYKAVYEHEYDAVGNLIKKTQRDDASGEVNWWHEYEYDENGNEIKFSRGYDVTAGALCRYEYEYDDKGNMIKCIDYTIQEGFITTVFEYDVVGNKIKSTNYYSEDEEVSSWCDFTYDSNGNLIVSRYTYYDDFGWFNEETGRWEPEEISECVEREYDAHGNLTKEIKYGGAYDDTYNQDLYYAYKYDEKGVMIRRTEYSALQKNENTREEIITYEYYIVPEK